MKEIVLYIFLLVPHKTCERGWPWHYGGPYGESIIKEDYSVTSIGLAPGDFKPLRPECYDMYVGTVTAAGYLRASEKK